jgi:hypothetical protein
MKTFLLIVLGVAVYICLASLAGKVIRRMTTGKQKNDCPEIIQGGIDWSNGQC